MLLQIQKQKVLICNVATENGETNNYNSSDHIDSIKMHIGKNIFDSVIINNNIEQFESKNNESRNSSRSVQKHTDHFWRYSRYKKSNQT